MKKRLVCIFLSLCLLILPGCGQWWEDAEQFRSAFARLQALQSVYVHSEQYYGSNFDDMELVLEREEWRNGEDFYRKNDDGEQYLSYGGNDWKSEKNRSVQWEQQSWPLYPISTWNHDAQSYLTGAVVFLREGENIILEQRKDLGSDNCTFSRQRSMTTVYMNENWDILKITHMTETYKGREVDPNKIHSVQKTVTYITPIDASEAEEKIQTQYKSLPQ